MFFKYFAYSKILKVVNFVYFSVLKLLQKLSINKGFMRELKKNVAVMELVKKEYTKVHV